MSKALARLAALTPQQRAKVLARTREKAGAGPRDEAAPLVPAPRDGRPLPASYVQEQFWFMDRMQPGLPTYNAPFSFRITGPVDVEALAGALTEITARHEVLRTRLLLDNDRLVQQIVPASQSRTLLERVDLTGATEEALREKAFELVRTAFDLDNGSLVRTVLVSRTETDHLLVWVGHHSIVDGLSFGVLAQELAALYEPVRTGRPHTLPPVEIQFADFAVWQRENLVERRADLVRYWRENLAGAVDLDLPCDLPRPPKQTYDGATQWFTVPAGTTASLRELSRESGHTLFMTLLAAYYVLLGKHSGQEDVTVGVPVSGRGRAETQSMIGAFLNTIPLRADLSGDPTCRDFLAQVAGVVLSGFAHQDLPFGQLVEELVELRDPSRNPVYQAMFGFGNTPVSETEMTLGEGVSMIPRGVANGTARVEFEIVLEEVGDELIGRLEYNTALFSADTARRMAARYQQVLGGFAADPDQKLSDLPLVTADELATIARWNDTGVEYPLDSALHELITAQARRTPTAVAVRCGAGSLTYQELDEASNRLANLLWANGTEAGELVGVCLDRSSQALVALLGVLKAGAAYVPLDPTYPVARLEYMLADTELRTLVTSGGQTLPFETPSVTVIDTVDSAGFDTQPLNLPGDTAYVIYTSGSTGRPKGVVIEHRSAVNLFYSMQERISLTPSDVQLTVTSPSFDMAVPELLMPLVFGASVYVAPKEAAADGGKLLSLLLESRTTVLQATPTTWQLLVDAGLGRGQLRLALCTSEAMPAAVAGALHDRVPAVWNLYGPTEATVFATMRQIEEEDGHSAPPIGLPLGNTTLHVLDRYQRTTPIGAVGELYIGGAGLAREYLGRAKLTGERFVSLDGERVYRTGDLVRQRPDGTVEYCGRIDNQIKLRGFRIELGEIETVAADHPGIRRALAALVAFGRDDQRIVCYLTPAEGATPPTAEELREHASGRLPSYMVPAHFVVVDEFPLTPNGKVDRSALVRLPVGGPASVQEPPRTPLEGTLAEIWADLLGVASVGRDDDFFGLGGHSLLAIQAISRIQERCAVTLTVDVVFDKPTVARLAVVVEERQAEARDLLLSALARVEGMSESAVTAMLSELETTVQQ